MRVLPASRVDGKTNWVQGAADIVAILQAEALDGECHQDAAGQVYTPERVVGGIHSQTIQTDCGGGGEAWRGGEVCESRL